MASIHRLEKRDRLPRAACFERYAAPPKGSDYGKKVVSGGGQSWNCRPDHEETRATPQITSDAPTHRTQLTRSRRRYFASTVSKAYVMAVAGTAKLSSEVVRRPR